MVKLVHRCTALDNCYVVTHIDYVRQPTFFLHASVSSVPDSYLVPDQDFEFLDFYECYSAIVFVCFHVFKRTHVSHRD